MGKFCLKFRDVSHSQEIFLACRPTPLVSNDLLLVGGLGGGTDVLIGKKIKLMGLTHVLKMNKYFNQLDLFQFIQQTLPTRTNIYKYNMIYNISTYVCIYIYMHMASRTPLPKG